MEPKQFSLSKTVIAICNSFVIILLYTAISKKVVIVNSRYWNRKELRGLRSTKNVL